MLNAKDASLIATGALPNGAASTTTGSIDLGLSATGEAAYLGEFSIDAPALTTAQLPDTQTMTYDVIISNNSDLSSPTTLYKSVLVQTGAGGAGAAAASARFRPPLAPGGEGSAKRYIGVKATNSGAGNASTVSVTVSALI